MLNMNEFTNELMARLESKYPDAQFDIFKGYYGMKYLTVLGRHGYDSSSINACYNVYKEGVSISYIVDVLGKDLVE